MQLKEKRMMGQRKIVISGSRDQNMCECVVCSPPPPSPDLIRGARAPPPLHQWRQAPPPPAVSSYCTFSGGAEDLFDGL
jgi:hypothetical protein